MPGAKSYAFASTLAATLLAAAALQGCGGTDNGGPSLSADLKPLTAEERADAKNLTTADVAEIAKNRKKVSCIELTMGSLQSFALEVASPEKPAEPNVAATEAPAAVTPPATATPATSDQQLIDDEKACHCDRGVAMAGFELYERREHLLKQSKYPEIRNELAAY